MASPEAQAKHTLSLDLGTGVPVTISAGAHNFARRLPAAALRANLAAVERWAQGAPIRAGRIVTFTDPEADDWTQLLVDLLVATDDIDRAIELWDGVAERLNEVMQGLPAEEQDEMNAKFGVHVFWGADGWNDDSTDV